jgi:hypothetical protein
MRRNPEDSSPCQAACPDPFLAASLTAAWPAIGPGHGGGMHRHGAGGMMMHDEVTMPGLRGLDATPEESAEMMVMFHHFPEIFRRSKPARRHPDRDRLRNPMVMQALASHVSGMIARVEDGRDPQVFIQSPTLDIFFERTGAIRNGDRADRRRDHRDPEKRRSRTCRGPAPPRRRGHRHGRPRHAGGARDDGWRAGSNRLSPPCRCRTGSAARRTSRRPSPRAAARPRG